MELMVEVQNGTEIDRRTVCSDDPISCLSSNPTRSRFFLDGQMVHGAFSFGFLGVKEGSRIIVRDPAPEPEAPRFFPRIAEKARLWDLTKSRIESGKGYRQVVRRFLAREARLDEKRRCAARDKDRSHGQPSDCR
jgi:hypothetical protein